jgi:hypothetical protein
MSTAPTLTESEITLALGHAVPHPHAPEGLAQIDELLRRNVVLIYRTKKLGRLRRSTVSASEVAQRIRRAGARGELPLPLTNILGRGVRPREKTYPLS